MQFTGKNLALVRIGLAHALGDIHNQIASCPDPANHEDALDELELVAESITRLAARIDARHPDLELVIVSGGD